MANLLGSNYAPGRIAPLSYVVKMGPGYRNQTRSLKSAVSVFPRQLKCL